MAPWASLTYGRIMQKNARDVSHKCEAPRFYLATAQSCAEKAIGYSTSTWFFTGFSRVRPLI